MVILHEIRALAAGTVLAAFGGASSASATLYYATSNTTSAAPGTIPSGAVNPQGGGLCILNNPGCISGAAAPLTNGLITATATPSVGFGNYSLAVTLAGNGTASFGSIWDVTLVNGNTGTNLGYTKIVGLGTEGSGTVKALVSGTGSFTIGVTNLLEQYYNQTDTLPGFLSGNSADPRNGGTVANATSGFTVTYSLTPASEPASLGLFGGGLAAVGALRRGARPGRLGSGSTGT